MASDLDRVHENEHPESGPMGNSGLLRLPHFQRRSGAIDGESLASRGGEGTDDEWEHTLWRRHLVMGIGSFTLGNALLFGYLALTPHGPHRVLSMTIVAVGVVFWLGIFAPIGVASLHTKWRVPFFFFWSVTTLALIAALAGFDGGSGSPVISFLVLPVLYAALVYPLISVVALAVVAEIFYVIVVTTEPVASLSRASMTGLSLALAGVIAVMAAVNRNAQNQSQQGLMSRLHTLATHDGLTGCLTYQAFQDALESETARARRHQRPFTIVMLDLDSFKQINDTYGHDVGDVTLRVVVQALLAGARQSDVVGRLGGDELAVLLPETDATEARLAAKRLQAHVRLADTPVGVTVSFGVATWTFPSDGPAEVTRRADQALYGAKRAGRDRLVVWEAARAER